MLVAPPILHMHTQHCSRNHSVYTLQWELLVNQMISLYSSWYVCVGLAVNQRSGWVCTCGIGMARSANATIQDDGAVETRDSKCPMECNHVSSAIKFQLSLQFRQLPRWMNSCAQGIARLIRTAYDQNLEEDRPKRSAAAEGALGDRITGVEICIVLLKVSTSITGVPWLLPFTSTDDHRTNCIQTYKTTIYTMSWGWAQLQELRAQK